MSDAIIPNILLIAPLRSPGLANLQWVDSEIEALVNSGLRFRLERDVNERRLHSLLTDGSYDMIWFASHGSRDGVYLSDGVITADALSEHLRGSGISYVVLNTCESVHVAAAISEEAGADVICTITEVTDKQAWRTAALFANGLASGLGVYPSFRRARPAQAGKYIYLPGLGGVQDRRFQDSVKELADAVANGDSTRIEESISHLMALAERVDLLDTRLSAVERKLSPPGAALIMMSLASLMLILDIFAIWTAVTTHEILAVVRAQPVVFVIAQIGLLLLIVTWTWWAALRIKQHNRRG